MWLPQTGVGKEDCKLLIQIKTTTLSQETTCCGLDNQALYPKSLRVNKEINSPNQRCTVHFEA